MKIRGYKYTRIGIEPEQYEVYNKEGEFIAFVQLKHGFVTAECPDINGEQVYRKSVGESIYVNEFSTEIERQLTLSEIQLAIEKWENKNTPAELS